MYDGVPYILLGTEVRECHYGPDRKKKSKNQTESETDHCYEQSKKRRFVQVSKKLGCTCQLKFRMIIRFPTFKIQGLSSHMKRKQVIQRLRNTFCGETPQEFRVLVKQCGTHHGHIIGEEAGYGQPLDKTVIHKIKSLVIEDGVRTAADLKAMLEIHIKNIECPEKNRRFHPTMQDIRNHMAAALNENRYHRDDQQNALMLTTQWKEKFPEDVYFIRASTANETFLFVHQTKFQQRLLRRYGAELVLMDSTYKTSKYAMPLFFMAVLTNCGYQVVSTFIVQHENTADIAEALGIIQDNNRTWSPTAFMCDMDQREIGAIEATFEKCKVYTCAFHREQSWSRWLKKTCNGLSENRTEVLTLQVFTLRGIANSATVTDLDCNIVHLKESRAYLKNPLFQRWIHRYWLQNKERWVRCFRGKVMDLRVSTTNGVESLNKILKYKYLKKTGGHKSLSSLITVICEKFVPEAEDQYTRTNVLAKEQHRKYSAEIPKFLQCRPKAFVDHCMKRWRKCEEVCIAQHDGSILVSGYNVRTDVPSCECADFQKSNWPCKHMLKVVETTPENGWEFWPKAYTSLPCFVLDNQQDTETTPDTTSDQSSTPTPQPGVREHVLACLSELINCVYTIDDGDTLAELDVVLTEQLQKVKGAVPKIDGLPVRQTRRRSTKERKPQVKEPHRPTFEEPDEISRVLDDIWKSTPCLDPIVTVGHYIIRNNSFHYLRSTISDEVMDGCLYLVAKESGCPTLHISSVVCTAIFKGQHGIHGLLRQENIEAYDRVIGAINEGGVHWTLVIILPKDRTIIYMNPLGEIPGAESMVLQYWYDFWCLRHQAGLSSNPRQGWSVESPPHAKQPDGSSCGVYVIELARNFLHNRPLKFNWTRSDIVQARTRLARQLLAYGGPIDQTIEKVGEVVDQVEEEDQVQAGGQVEVVDQVEGKKQVQTGGQVKVIEKMEEEDQVQAGGQVEVSEKMEEEDQVQTGGQVEVIEKMEEEDQVQAGGQV